MLSLPCQFVVPYPVRASELLDFTAQEWRLLEDGGVVTYDLPPDAVAEALQIKAGRGRLSANDSFCLVATARHEEAVLLTGDQFLRRVAGEMGLTAHGVLWLTDQLHAGNHCPLDLLISALHSREWSNALVAPQQLVLMIQLGGVLIAVYQGAYPDGYRPADDWWGSMWFILADQAPLIAMCLSHTIELAFGGLVNAEREYYQRELKETQKALDSCNRCWQMQREAKFWEDIASGPIAGPNQRVE
jgi:hypothetical protein